MVIKIVAENIQGLYKRFIKQDLKVLVSIAIILSAYFFI